ncbi:hypothetical protein F0562_005150 [Nyssa sinensis]|uniref:Uncharacterized protein n=1 Tax=Nyssa sinensis TaxID=561372 RepID=A0A5J5AMY8_9ASTE|nr:hypothetical protein F0562_005150 [Nyssa sinensis]
MELRRNHSSLAKNVVVDDNCRYVEKVCGGVGDDGGYDTGGVVLVTVVAMAMGLVKPLAMEIGGGVGDDGGYGTGGGDTFGSGSNFCRLQLWVVG